jgi:hypothetical protein
MLTLFFSLDCLVALIGLVGKRRAVITFSLDLIYMLAHSWVLQEFIDLEAVRVQFLKLVRLSRVVDAAEIRETTFLGFF